MTSPPFFHHRPARDRQAAYLPPDAAVFDEFSRRATRNTSSSVAFESQIECLDLALTLSKVERFVALLEATDPTIQVRPFPNMTSPTRRDRANGRWDIEALYKSHVLDVELLAGWQCRFAFSPRANLLIEVVQKHVDYLRFIMAHRGARLYETDAKLVNSVLQEVRGRAQQPAFRKHLARHRQAHSRSWKSLCKLVDALFARHQCLSVVHIELNNFGLEDADLAGAVRLRERLLNKLRHAPSVFRHMVGYVLKLEPAFCGRVYLDAIFMFDGSKRIDAKETAQSIGSYWVKNHTLGEGGFNHYHGTAQERKGTGYIPYSAAPDIDALKCSVLGYMAGVTQFFDIRDASGVQVLTRSNLPPGATTIAGSTFQLPRDLVDELNARL